MASQSWMRLNRSSKFLRTASRSRSPSSKAHSRRKFCRRPLCSCLTDRDDTASQSADLELVTSLARREGLPIHTLTLGKKGMVKADDLRQLAENTRGRAFTASQADELRDIFEEIARNLGQTYSLSYT